ncbi:MAG: hypothetical protein ACOCUQ_02725 [Bacteroidota bacterium]
MEYFDHGHSRLLPGLIDFVVMGFYLMLMFLVAHYIQNRNQEINPAYKYYKWGLFASVLGAIALCMVYSLYYKDGGDSTMFFRNSQSLVKLLFKDPANFFRILFGHRSPEIYYVFDNDTGWPWMFRDPESFVVVRFASVFTLLGLGNYYTASILVAWVTYTGSWRLYLLFCQLYPGLEKYFAAAILFYPSLVFWGSPILKDSFSLMAIGFFTYSFYHGLIERRQITKNLLIILLSAIVIVSIKAYILVALMPGVFIWFSFARLKRIQNPVLRWALAPSVIIVFLFLAFGFLSLFSESLGEYGNVQAMITKAMITQDDLMRGEAYSENYFDIGRIDGTLTGFVKLAPQAIIAGIYRPFLWDVRNVLMLLAGIENTILLLVSVLIFWRTGIVKGIKIIANEPLVIFSLLFAIIFAFAVGVTTANFGALVRLRIPLLPFFAGSLAILYNLSLQYKMEKNKESLVMDK